MKQYRIKTSEFKNLTEKNKILDKNLKQQITSIEKSTDKTIYKALAHGKNIVLSITTDAQYLITARPCYQPSIINILKSVDIDDDDIHILVKSSTPVELSTDELKTLLKAPVDDDDSDDDSDDEK